MKRKYLRTDNEGKAYFVNVEDKLINKAINNEIKKELPWYLKMFASLIVEILLKWLDKNNAGISIELDGEPLYFTPIHRPTDGSQIENKDSIKD